MILKAGAYDNVIRLLAPLVITEDLLVRGLDILEDVVKGVDKWRSLKRKA